MDNATATHQARLFKALMHPVRIQILELLRGGEQCVCHLEAYLDLRQAYVSQQLAVLRKAGLVSDRRDGPNSYYQIARPELLQLLDLARTMVCPEGSTLAKHRVTCPCPRCNPSRDEAIQTRILKLKEELPC
ncbi:ArsR/SmtB family transcription factor [Candidatus Viridilinea mediisalina]|uniref:Transcriptional regulator n=1 Tax=Candidatus Viridilinea mediisalina TaxID=2024553 RepID=A0A2A6RPY8_9CHLR|nr:metalloregulator ArsR/SmtB family transcription factor [Candidatus Viridilinea mediisalina]PDW04996.1 transcriptional regulator [Candidatus Viridilinea mediisalina]